MTNDPRIVTALKALAYGYLNESDMGETCHYCTLGVQGEREQHEPTCPILLARAVLREMGMPLCTYRLTWEHLLHCGWKHMTIELDAYSEEEALARFQGDTPRHEHIRNIQAVLVREVMP